MHPLHSLLGRGGARTGTRSPRACTRRTRRRRCSSAAERCALARRLLCGSSGAPLSTRECRCRRRTPSWISRSRNGRGKSCRRSWATTSTLSTRREVCLCVCLLLCSFVCLLVAPVRWEPIQHGRAYWAECDECYVRMCAYSASAAIVVGQPCGSSHSLHRPQPTGRRPIGPNGIVSLPLSAQNTLWAVRWRGSSARCSSAVWSVASSQSAALQHCVGARFVSLATAEQSCVALYIVCIAQRG